MMMHRVGPTLLAVMPEVSVQLFWKFKALAHSILVNRKEHRIQNGFAFVLFAFSAVNLWRQNMITSREQNEKRV
jgi:hypothetical protein